MKILLIQLARFGDTFQTWPTVKALKRTFPACQVHVMVRSKFSSAITLLPTIDKVWTLDTEKVIEPLVIEDYKMSLSHINLLTDELSAQDFDHVINLTFSSFSSFVTSKVKSKSKRGYFRFKDGSPAFGDLASSYFYSQVGVGEANRIHVCDLFARVAGVKLKEEDWNFRDQFKTSTSEKYIVIHLGASHPKKCLPIQTWTDTISHLVQQKIKIKLIGSANEADLGSYVCERVQNIYVENLVGKTNFEETFRLIANAELFVGCDSAPLQIASLMNTKSLNLSFSTVNFWETGPKASGSCVLIDSQPAGVQSTRVWSAIINILEGFPIDRSARVADAISEYEIAGDNDLGWDLVKFIYFNGLGPKLNTIEAETVRSLYNCAKELVRLARSFITNSATPDALTKLNTLEQKISTLQNTRLRPLISWFEAEKISIPPSDFKTVVAKTLSFYLKFESLTRNLLMNSSKEIVHGSHQVEP